MASTTFDFDANSTQWNTSDSGVMTYRELSKNQSGFKKQGLVCLPNKAMRVLALVCTIVGGGLLLGGVYFRGVDDDTTDVESSNTAENGDSINHPVCNLDQSANSNPMSILSAAHNNNDNEVCSDEQSDNATSKFCTEDNVLQHTVGACVGAACCVATFATYEVCMNMCFDIDINDEETQSKKEEFFEFLSTNTFPDVSVQLANVDTNAITEKSPAMKKAMREEKEGGKLAVMMRNKASKMGNTTNNSKKALLSMGNITNSFAPAKKIPVLKAVTKNLRSARNFGDKSDGEDSEDSESGSNSKSDSSTTNSDSDSSENSDNFDRGTNEMSTFYHGRNSFPDAGKSWLQLSKNEEQSEENKNLLNFNGYELDPLKWPVDFNYLKNVKYVKLNENRKENSETSDHPNAMPVSSISLDDPENAIRNNEDGIRDFLWEFKHWVPQFPHYNEVISYDTEYRRVERAIAFSILAYMSPYVNADLKEKGVDRFHRTTGIENKVSTDWFPQIYDTLILEWSSASQYLGTSSRAEDVRVQQHAIDEFLSKDYFEENKFQENTQYYRNMLSTTGAADFSLGGWNTKMVLSEKEKISALVSFNTVGNRSLLTLASALLANGFDLDEVKRGIVEAEDRAETDVVIAFRGTIDEYNWKAHNLKQNMVDSCDAHDVTDNLPQGAGFHEGYRCVAWPSIRDSVFEVIDEIMMPDNREDFFPTGQPPNTDDSSPLEESNQTEEETETRFYPIMRSKLRKLRFHVTGHSMGAGLATIAGLELHTILSDEELFEQKFPKTFAAAQQMARIQGYVGHKFTKWFTNYRKNQRIGSIIAVACSGVVNTSGAEAFENAFNPESVSASDEERKKAEEWGKMILNKGGSGDWSVVKNETWENRIVRLEYEKDQFANLAPHIKMIFPNKKKMPGGLVSFDGDIHPEDKDKGPMIGHQLTYYMQGAQTYYTKARVSENKRYSEEEL